MYFLNKNQKNDNIFCFFRMVKSFVLNIFKVNKIIYARTFMLQANEQKCAENEAKNKH